LLAVTVFGQGRCRDGYGTSQCPLTRELATAPIKPVFASSGWKTVALDRITFVMPDYRKEAAFYIALATQTSGVGMDRAAEIVLQYLLLTYSYGINYRKIELVSRSL